MTRSENRGQVNNVMGLKPLEDGPAFQRPVAMLYQMILFGRFPKLWIGRTKMKRHLARLWKEEEGQDLVEYALLLVLISLAAIGGLGPLAAAINGVFANAATNLNT